MMRKKSSAQLDREIAKALKRPVKGRSKATRIHHALRRATDDDWDVAMDAILANNPARAAQIVRNIRQERGMEDATKAFLKAVNQAPASERAAFYALIDARDPAPKQLSEYAPLPRFYKMVKHPSDMNIWFKATEELKKPGYKGIKVEWYLGDRKPKKAKASTIHGLDISQGYYKQVAEQELPPEVAERFFERS